MGSVVRPREIPQRHTPVRRPNHELRTREHLTEREVEKLIEAAKGNRWGHRDATMILIAYRHGLRTSELVDLRWDQVHLTSAKLDVRRKNDSPLLLLCHKFWCPFRAAQHGQRGTWRSGRNGGSSGLVTFA